MRSLNLAAVIVRLAEKRLMTLFLRNVYTYALCGREFFHFFPVVETLYNFVIKNLWSCVTYIVLYRI